MIDIEKWIKQFLNLLDETFQDRVWFVGLQGSYGRGEATETSDIDMVVILDELSAEDIAKYHRMVDMLPSNELACGFLSGKAELMKWEKSDLFQFCYDTKAIRGSLDDVLSTIAAEDVMRAIKIGACNIYHGCVHNMLYERDEEILKGLYKSAAFVVQAICYRQTGMYIGKQKELLDIVEEEEKIIVQTALDLKQGKHMEFEKMSESLFCWAKKWIIEYL